MDSQSRNWLQADASATVFVKDFAAVVRYSSPSHYLGGYSHGITSYWPQTYGLTLAYSIKRFRINLDFDNWFRRDGYVYENYTSPRYSYSSKQWKTSPSRSLSLSLIYTFSYGRKIQEGQELGTNSGAGSAVLN